MRLLEGKLPVMTFYHTDNKPRAYLKMFPDGNPTLRLIHPDGKPRVTLSLFEAEISDLNGKAYVAIGESGNSMKLMLVDEKKETVFQVGAPEQ